jgi:hypothetical protein
MLRLLGRAKNLSTIKRITYSQVGLNDSENDALLQSYPGDQFVRATADYQICVDHTEDLNKHLRPSLKGQMRGSFSLAIYNHGNQLAKSMLVFEVFPIKRGSKHPRQAVITDDPMELTAQSLAVLPFVDVFRGLIEREAQRCDRLIKASRVTSLGAARQESERNTVNYMTKIFVSKSRGAGTNDDDQTLMGKDAISDVLAPSLSATRDFYNKLWDEMIGFYEPSFRYVAEQHALGKISLESPGPISG